MCAHCGKLLVVKRWVQGLYTLWKIASGEEVDTGSVHIVENC